MLLLMISTLPTLSMNFVSLEPLAASPIPAGAGACLLTALLISSIGFARVVYFVSLGYAFSMVAQCVVAGVSLRDALEPLVVAQLVLVAAHGLRLGGFLLKRERSASYRRNQLAEVDARSRGLGVSAKLAIWLSVSALYVMMFYPALTNLAARSSGDLRPGALPIGLAVMALGLGLEALADRQKSVYKARRADRFCDVGLYRWVRCPNYLGEVLFWTGQFIAGVGHYSHWSHWLISGLALVMLVFIMIDSAKRLEQKQDERYGARADYQRYVREVPILLPWVPLYSLKHVKTYVS